MFYGPAHMGSDTTFKCTAQWLVTYENTIIMPSQIKAQKHV